MARSDADLVEEVRALTGYDDAAMFTDSDIQALIDIAKEELRSRFGSPTFEFYRRTDTVTLDADRALFWFTCIALKVRAGEIGSVELTVDSLEQNQSQGQFDYWFQNFADRVAAADASTGSAGAATTTITRGDERTYEHQQPDYGGG